MTQHSEEKRPAVGPVETIAQRVKELRRKRGWSAAQLAEQLRGVGLDWDRNIVANLETGRRANVSVSELLALAQVLTVAPMHLLVPLDNEQPYQVTPTQAEPAWVVRGWIAGVWPLHTVDGKLFITELPEGWSPSVLSGRPDDEEQEQVGGFLAPWPDFKAMSRLAEEVRKLNERLGRIEADPDQPAPEARAERKGRRG
jgi:transcriptional regulator with XRE-family HTH domain